MFGVPMGPLAALQRLPADVQAALNAAVGQPQPAALQAAPLLVAGRCGSRQRTAIGAA